MDGPSTDLRSLLDRRKAAQHALIEDAARQAGLPSTASLRRIAELENVIAAVLALIEERQGCSSSDCSWAVCSRVADRTGLSTSVSRGPDLIGNAGAGACPVRPFAHQPRWAVDLDTVGLGLGNPGEEQHGNMTGGENGSNGDGFEETHGWLLTLRRGLCGSALGRGKARLAFPLLE
jgi:hypothetical protein